MMNLLQSFPAAPRPSRQASRQILRRLVVALAAAGLGAVGAVAQPAPAGPAGSAQEEVRYEPGGDGFVIVISLRGHVGSGGTGAPASVRQDRRDLFLSFAGAAPAFDAADLQRRAQRWIDGVSVGYDSVLLRLARGVTAAVDNNGATLTLRLATEPSADAPLASAQVGDSGGGQRLELLRAQLLLQDRNYAQARERFAALREAMPRRVEPVLGLAALESQTGRWRSSLERYREAISLGGENPDIGAALVEIERAQASRASLGVERRSSRGGELDAPVDVTLTQARGMRRLGDAWRIGVDADSADVDTRAVRRASGVIEPFSGRRTRGAVSTQHDALDGTATAASLLLGRGTAGLGLLLRRPDDFGATGFGLDWRRPNWDFVEAIVDDALRDRLAVQRSQRLGSHLGGRLELGYNRYHRGGLGELARSASVAAELRLDTLADVRGLALAYSLDGEYVDRVASRRTPAGETFEPLPLVDREVHSVTLAYARSSGNRWSGSAFGIDAYAGLGTDRYGRGGPIAALTLTYARGAIDLQLRASHVRNVGRSVGRTNAVGASVSVLF